MAAYATEHIQPLGAASQLPFFWGEFGLSNNGTTDGTLWWTSDATNVHVHNAMWGSAVSGAAGGAMHWWWHEFDDHNAYTQFAPVRAFMNRVDVLGRRWTFFDASPSNGTAPTPPHACNTTALPQMHFDTRVGTTVDHFVAENASGCQAACCSNAACDGWVYTTSQPKGNFPPCVERGRCCWLKEHVGYADLEPSANSTAGVERGAGPLPKWTASGIRGRAYPPTVHASVGARFAGTVAPSAAINDTVAMWVRNPAHTWQRQHLASAGVVVGPVELAIPLMAPGHYSVIVVDTSSGAVVQTRDVAVLPGNNTLVVVVPPFKYDCAIVASLKST
jgi:hypothetical protein